MKTTTIIALAVAALLSVVGFDNERECRSTNETLPATQRCIEDALSREPAAAAQWLGCRLQLEAEYTECIYARLTCGDWDSTDDCVADWKTGLRDCIELPPSIDRAVRACDGEPT